MNIDILSDRIRVTKDFRDGIKRVVVGYSGGIPAGSSLGTGSCQGVIVYYRKDSTGTDDISCDIMQYGSPSGSLPSFKITVFVMEEGGAGADDDGETGELGFV